MEELGRVPLKSLTNLRSLRVAKIGEPPKEPLELGLARLAPARFELLDDRRRRAVMHVGHETQRFILDDRKCCRQFPLAALAIGVAGRREIGFSVRGPKPSPHSRTSS